MDQIIVRFKRNGAGLVPVVVSGLSFAAKRVDVENAVDFEGQIEEGAEFAVTVIEARGRGANREVTVRLERRIATQTDEPLKDFWVDERQWRWLLMDLRLGHHVLLRGPKGTGKTTLCYHLASHLGIPILKVDCTGIYKPKDLVGAEGSREGTLYFVPNEMVEFLAKARGKEGRPTALVLLDELSRIRGNGEGLHPLLDDTRRLSVSTNEGTRVIEVPPGVVFIATANPVGSGHVGTAEIDVALEDRFEPYDLDYPPAEFEIGLLTRRTGIRESEAGRIVEAANALREKARAGLFPRGGGPSPRRTLHTAAFVARGVPLVEAVEAKLVIACYRGDPNRDTTERGIAYATLRSKAMLQMPSSGGSRVNLREAR